MDALTLFRSGGDIVPVVINPYTRQAEEEPFYQMVRDVCAKTVKARFVWSKAYVDREILTHWDAEHGAPEPLTVVFRAKRPTHESVVVKTLKVDRTSRVPPDDQFAHNMHEVYFCNKLCRGSHPNLVRFHGAWAYEKFKEIFIEFDDGGDSLDELIHRAASAPDGPVVIPQPTLAGYIQQVLAALAYIHSQSVIHCDVKGGNILIRDGHVRLADFGVARETPGPFKPIEGAYEGVNTRGYVPYELLVKRRAPITSAVDVYALGCVFAVALTGNMRLFQPYEDDPAAALDAIHRFSGGNPAIPPVGLTAFFPALPQGDGHAHLHNLLARMLHWDQSVRIIAAAAMNHEYFISAQRAALSIK
jgi:serine/threonine protein kinase